MSRALRDMGTAMSASQSLHGWNPNFQLQSFPRKLEHI